MKTLKQTLFPKRDQYMTNLSGMCADLNRSDSHCNLRDPSHT